MKKRFNNSKIGRKKQMNISSKIKILIEMKIKQLRKLFQNMKYDFFFYIEVIFQVVFSKIIEMIEIIIIPLLM